MVNIGVLALQGGVREHVDMLTSLGANVSLVRRPDHLEGLEGIVFPGGESSTIDRLLRVFGLAGPLRDAIGGGLPALATCAGLITLAKEIEDPAPGQLSLGVLPVRVRRNAFGPQRDSAVEHFSTQLGEVTAAFIRAPEVVTLLDDDVEVLATTGENRIIGVTHGTTTAVSFHPELTGDSTLHTMLLKQAATAT